METIDSRISILEQRVKNLEAQLHGPVFGAALPSVLDIESIMNALDCSEYRAREIMKSGKLKVFRIGKKIPGHPGTLSGMAGKWRGCQKWITNGQIISAIGNGTSA